MVERRQIMDRTDAVAKQRNNSLAMLHLQFPYREGDRVKMY